MSKSGDLLLLILLIPLFVVLVVLPGFEFFRVRRENRTEWPGVVIERERKRLADEKQ